MSTYGTEIAFIHSSSVAASLLIVQVSLLTKKRSSSERYVIIISVKPRWGRDRFFLQVYAKTLAEFFEGVHFQQMFRSRHRPTLLNTNLLIGIFQFFTPTLLRIKEILVVASVICANALETRKKWLRQLT